MEEFSVLNIAMTAVNIRLASISSNVYIKINIVDASQTIIEISVFLINLKFDFVY